MVEVFVEGQWLTVITDTRYDARIGQLATHCENGFTGTIVEIIRYVDGWEDVTVVSGRCSSNSVVSSWQIGA